jgi:hypothetical protein
MRWFWSAFCWVFGHSPERLVGDSNETGRYLFECQDCGAYYRMLP